MLQSHFLRGFAAFANESQRYLVAMRFSLRDQISYENIPDHRESV